MNDGRADGICLPSGEVRLRATLTGRVDVAGGDGSVDCQLNSSGDDCCRLKIDINGGIGGGHHHEADW